MVHLQQWDFVREQTEWGVNGSLPFIQSVLMHNLDFYTAFMRRIQQSEDNHALYDIMESLIPRAWCEIVRNAFEVDK